MNALVRMLAAVAAIALLASGAAEASAPFVVTASSGPSAGAHIDATVTRKIGALTETLPAALVPALAPGDDVRLDFPDYRRPPGSVNYHVNVAFITEAAPQHWLFERSGPFDQLFENRAPKHRTATTPHGIIHFVYGAPNRRGIPIFFIIPEDGKTRGVDGVRDYVAAHPTDFVTMAQSTNDAVDHYSFLSDFLTSLGNGSIDPATARDRIESVAQSIGVSPATIDGCYATETTQADIRNCIGQSVNAVVYQTNFSAPTQAQFLGGIAAAASPVTYAPYLASLLTVWQLFVRSGHHEYEYLPTTIGLADPTTAHPGELLMGLKVPTLRPPAAYSDVLFFTIGDSQGTDRAPVIVNDAPAAGVCGRDARISLPLHFDHTSRYVNAAALNVTPDGRSAARFALDPRSLTAPVIDRAALPASPDRAFGIRLDARYGFDAIAQPAQPALRLALPSDVPWSVAPLPHHAIVAGGALDAIAASPSAACLTRAELQIGSAAPIAVTATHLDAGRVQLHAALTGLPAGLARIRFYEDDAAARKTYEYSTPIAIDPAPAHVTPASALAARGDRFVALSGSGFERVTGVRIAGSDYAIQPGSTATSACFTGPPIDAAPGQELSAQLETGSASGGEVFPLTVGPQRPGPVSAALLAPAASTVLSTMPLTVLLTTALPPLPARRAVRLRQAPLAAPDPCDAAGPDPTAITLPDAALSTRSAAALTVDVAPAVLGDRAFGTLQMQLVDTASGLGSDWTTLPATFVRAPAVAQIVCPSAADAPCRLYGTQLAAIDAVADAAGTMIAPDRDCPPSDKGLTCILIPHAGHVVLRLVDGGTIEPLPDALIAHAPH